MLIGAHTSIAKSAGPYDGVANAVHLQADIGGNCGQIFTHSPQVWQEPSIDDGDAAAFREATAERLKGPWVIHSSYLVNLCTPKDDLRAKSIDSMQREVDAAAALGLDPDLDAYMVEEYDDVRERQGGGDGRDRSLLRAVHPPAERGDPVPAFVGDLDLVLGRAAGEMCLLRGRGQRLDIVFARVSFEPVE